MGDQKRHGPLTGTGALNAQGCLFCLRHDGGFTSREHILSEAWGNVDEHVLPAGVVCDRCNNGILSRADEALVNFEPIMLLRAERGLGTKAGKPVMAKFGDTKIAWTAPGTMEVAAQSRKVLRGMREFDPAKGVPGKLNLTTSGPLTEKRISRMVRSVWKSALEFVYLDQGPGVAFGSALDGVRVGVLDEQGHGWALVPVESKAAESVQLSYLYPATMGDRPAFPITMSVFGVIFATDPLLRDLDADSIDAGVPVNRWTFS
jgi:hypothetical protein